MNIVTNIAIGERKNRIDGFYSVPPSTGSTPWTPFDAAKQEIVFFASECGYSSVKIVKTTDLTEENDMFVEGKIMSGKNEIGTFKTWSNE